MNILKLSLRNTSRNKQRTAVTILSMAFACSIMILFSSMMAGMVVGSERQVVEMNMGDIQIHPYGYLDDPDMYNRIHHSQAILAQLQNMGINASPRLYAFGLMATHATSSGASLRGIDLHREKRVTKLYQHVAKGGWLDEAKPKAVVLGKKMAATLDVDIGDELIFIGQSADGFMANDIFTVGGILKSVSDGIDRSGVFMLMPTFRTLMAIPERVHEIILRKPNPHSDLTHLTAQIKQLVPQYEVKNWKQLMPVVARMLETADVQTMIMLTITYIAVASIILNAMLMTVFERMHEFGIMKAIGVRPWQIVQMIFAETMIQVLIASAIALMLGWWVSDYFAVHGIDMSIIMDGSVSIGGLAFDPVWYTYITQGVLLTPIAFLIIIALLAVVYPAWKAAWVNPIDAIHYQ